MAVGVPRLGRGGQRVLGRAIWTNRLAFLPFTAFWIRAAVLSVLLVLGRLAVAGRD